MTSRPLILTLTAVTAVAVSSVTATSGAATSAHQQTTAHSAVTSATSLSERPINLRLDDQGKVAAGAIPDAANFFTVAEMKRIFPGTTALSAHGTDVTLTFPKERSAHRSRLTITNHATGKTADVQSRWKAVKSAHQQRAKKNPGLYTFFGAQSSGVADSFSDGSTVYVLLSNSGASSYLTITGIGVFGHVTDHEAARKSFRTTATRGILDALGRKVAAGNSAYAKEQAKKKAASDAAKEKAAASAQQTAGSAA